VLREQFQKRPDVTRVILFNGNFGQHMAIMAGFAHCRGARIVTLDADLQNPPEEISNLLAEMDKGHDYVGTIRRMRQDSAFRRYASRAMNKLRERITSIKMTDQGCMLRAYSRGIVDAINSSGAVFVPILLKKLGIQEQSIIVLNGEVNGRFAHNPEPLPQHLTQLSASVIANKADLGISVDPDVDRLVLVCEDGSMFGEEYTLVAVADYILGKTKGDTVSNLSSTRALKDITEKHGGKYHPAAVGEVNVVAKMKEVNAVIGGEGNGGIIVPDFHYGRDALIGIALFLTHLSQSNKTVKQLRSSYPDYFISKNKIEMDGTTNLNVVFEKLKEKYKSNPLNTIDGLRIEFDNDWVHLRSSNTEPIIRIIAESNFETTANNIASKLIRDIQESL
jgi:phosphomannomutase